MPQAKSMRSAVLTALASLGLLIPAAQPEHAHAQVRASEKAMVRQVISGTEIEVEYYRPSVRERAPIFGGVVHWGEVWTPGANYATTLRTSKDIELNDVTVPAGKYGLWIEVLEEGPWTLVVHADTLRGHGSHPTVDEGLYAIPVEPMESPDFTETLMFSVAHVRATSAELRLDWGDVRVPMALAIDLGVETTVAPETAAAIDGEWMYDDTPSLPSEEELEDRLAAADERGFGNEERSFYDAMLALQRPRPVRFARDLTTGNVLFFDEIQDEAYASLGAPDDESGENPNDGAWAQILIPRPGGTYAVAYAINGELASFHPEFAPLIEFEYDDDGRAVSFTWRNRDDEVVGTGARR